MAQTDKKTLLTASPHFAAPVNTRMIMYSVLIALVPLAVWGVKLYGVPALLTILVATASALAAETLFRLLLKRDVRALDGSAAITGLLLALSLPPGVPLWMTAMGAAFGVIVGKEFFGGLGANIFNPALVGRAFLVMSFPAELTSWSVPGVAGNMVDAGNAVDAVSTATPLNFLKMGGNMNGLGEQLAHFKLADSASYGDLLKALFLGNHGGCIGETSILFIITGGLFLMLLRVIDWRGPLAMIVTTALGALALGMDVPFTLFSGALLFSAVFMITDYVTSPVTPLGRLIFGAGVGAIILIIRRFGAYPEGVTFAILAMNAITPFLDKLLPRKYGTVKKIKADGGAR